MFEKAKKFVKDHQKGLLLLGGVALGVTATVLYYKSLPVQVEYKFPTWAIKWRAKCDVEGLLYENGLPIFANAEQTIVYRDACVEEFMDEIIASGIEVIDRV